MVIGIKINDVLLAKPAYYNYKQGINNFVDLATITLNDPNQSKWSTYDKTYLNRDVKIYNKYGEGGEYIAFRGRIVNVPTWQNGQIVFIVKGYMDQFGDRGYGPEYSVEDVDPLYDNTKFTGWITALTATTLKDFNRNYTDNWVDYYMCIIDTLTAIPSSEQYLSIDWEGGSAEIIVQAAGDDTDFDTVASSWGYGSDLHNFAGNDGTGVGNAYFRYPLNIPYGATVTNADWRVNVVGACNDTLKIYLIDGINCTQFPANGAGNEDDYTVASSPTPVDCVASSIGWMEFDITSLVTAFVNRSGYVPGNYIGIRVDNNSLGVGKYALLRCHEQGSKSSIKAITFTNNPPDKIQYKITGISGGDTLTLASFSLTGLMLGKPYFIVPMTSKLLKDVAEAFDLDETVTVSTENSDIGIVRNCLIGSKPNNAFRDCGGVDGYILRLKNDLTLLNKPFASIASAGTLPSDITRFSTSYIPGYMYNKVIVVDRFGQTVERGWNYTTHAPQDGDPTNLPAGYVIREHYLSVPEFSDKTICTELADKFLTKHAEPSEDDAIEVTEKGDIEFEPGERATFSYKGTTYTNYLITAKSYDSRRNECDLKLLKS